MVNHKSFESILLMIQFFHDQSIESYQDSGVNNDVQPPPPLHNAKPFVDFNLLESSQLGTK